MTASTHIHPIDEAVAYATRLRDLLRDLNIDDFGDHEAYNAPRLTRAEALATELAAILGELR